MRTTQQQGGGVLEESEMSLQESWMGVNRTNTNTISRGIQFTQVTAKYSPGRATTTILQTSSSPVREATSATTATSSSRRRFRAVTSTTTDDDGDDAAVEHNQPTDFNTSHQRPLSQQYDEEDDGVGMLDDEHYGARTTTYHTQYGDAPPLQEEEANFVSLGLTLSNRREQLGLPGVHVHRVAPNSPADLVGLRPNDIIVEWNPKVEDGDGGGQGGVFQVHRLAHIEELVQMQATEGVSELEIVFLNHLRVHPSMMADGGVSPPTSSLQNTSSVAYTVGNPHTNNNNNNTSTTSSGKRDRRESAGGSMVHTARRGVITIEGGSLYPAARNKRREPYYLPGVTQPRHECPHEEHPFHPQCLTKYRSPSTTSSSALRR